MRFPSSLQEEGWGNRRRELTSLARDGYDFAQPVRLSRLGRAAKLN